MRKRIGELEILRAVAAFAVVMIHVTASPLATLPTTNRSFFLYSLINQWSRFSIPAFVLITGIVLFHTYGRRAEFNAREFYTKRLQAIAIPYLLWSLFYLIWRARVEGNWAQLPQNLASSLVRGNAMYQLYFIVLILQYYALFPLIRLIGRSRWLLPTTAAALLIQFILMWDTYHGLFTQQITLPWLVDLLKWRDRLFPWWIGYFMTGTLIAAYLEHFLAAARRYLWPVVGTAAALFAWMMVEYMQTVVRPGVSVGFAASGFRPSAYLYSLAVILALLAVGGWVLRHRSIVERVLLEYGKHSFGIFLVHPFLLDLTVRLLGSMTPMQYLAVVSPVVLVGSYLFSRVVSAIPRGHWVVGRT